MEDKRYRVIDLSIRNFMGIETAEVSPDGKSMVISGPNESGKTSVLDAIFAALTGKLPHVPEPVRQGTDQAVINVNLGELKVVELTVTRKFGKGEGVVVESDTARLKSPQAVLDAIVEQIALDPLAFPEMKPKDQTAVLREIVDMGDVDPEDVLEQIAVAEEERKVAGRAMRDSQGVMQEARGVAPDEDPGFPRSASEVLEKQKEEDEKRDLRNSVQADIETLTKTTDKLLDERGTLLSNIEEMKARLATMQEDAERKMESAEKMRAQANELNGRLAGMPEPDYSVVEAEGAAIEEHNQQVNAWRAYENVLGLHKRNKEAHANLDQQVTSLRNQLTSAIASAEYPVTGLSLSEDLETVLYNDVPLSQAPTSVQLLVGVKVAVAQNPQLRVLRVQDGNDLDSAHLDQLFEIAEQNDFQVWIERVADSDGLEFTERDPGNPWADHAGG